MPDDGATDLYMMFMLNGTAIDGETQSDLQLTKSDMTQDFTPGKIFEVASFTLSTGIGSQDADDRKQKAVQTQMRTLYKNVQTMVHATKPQGAQPKLEQPTLPTEQDYSKFRNGDFKTKYPIDMDPVEFTRSLDRASSTLLQNCIGRVNYDSATLIKRRPAGGSASGEVFLRIDFTKVLMTNIEWSDDEPIKETCKFVCRAVTIHYKPQLPDGSLGAAIPGFWTMAPNLKQVQL